MQADGSSKGVAASFKVWTRSATYDTTKFTAAADLSSNATSGNGYTLALDWAAAASGVAATAAITVGTKTKADAAWDFAVASKEAKCSDMKTCAWSGTYSKAFTTATKDADAKAFKCVIDGGLGKALAGASYKGASTVAAAAVEVKFTTATTDCVAATGALSAVAAAGAAIAALAMAF